MKESKEGGRESEGVCLGQCIGRPDLRGSGV